MILTQDQKKALDAVDNLIIDPKENVLVISGSAGTGKSTLVKEVIKRYHTLYSTIGILMKEQIPGLRLTATTNKAAANLADITGEETQTFQKLLGMTIQHGKVFFNKKSLTNMIIIVDEFSYIDSRLAKAAMSILGISCKVIFIGDECQLPPPKEPNNCIPIIDSYNFPIVRLTQQVRQETSALKELGENLKQFVITGEMDEFEADDKSLIHYEDPELFTDELIASFNRGSSRFISYTNSRGVSVNEFIHEERTGTTEIKVGDVMTVNTYFVAGRKKFTTDAEVTVQAVKNITKTLIGKKGIKYDVNGKLVRADNIFVFVPDRFDDFTFYKGNTELFSAGTLEHIEGSFCDLRHLYASTVHKSQGSTFDEVFIDLTDFKSIRDTNMLARLLYVALTRARKKIHIIGEI